MLRDNSVFQIFVLFALAAVYAGCANDVRAENAVVKSLVTSERQAEFAKDDFDACTLTSPEETWAYWDIVLSEEDKQSVKSTPYSELIKFHMGWGMGIRNGFCLWSGGPLRDWFIERGVNHPDAMSGILIRLYWARLNSCHPDADAFVRSSSNGKEFLGCA